MNLYCSSGGEEVNLQQTPTYISYMCVVQPNGKIYGRLTGKKAKHALQMYCQWLRGTLNRVWNTKEDLEEAQKWINENILEIQSVIKRRRKLKVWVM
jgi:hypothetical protein